VIGKDIIRFHAVYWPAFLMSAGIALPKRVFAHGFLFNRGEKMSKSVGNVVDPFAMAKHYGIDQVRYFFLREVSFGQDGSYSHEAIVNRINADLANDLGNLAQRSLSMIGRYAGAAVPQPGELTAEDRTLLGAADALLERCRYEMRQQSIHLALSALWQVVADANRYFAAQEPWALRKTDPDRMATVLYVTAEVVRQVAILVQPVMPASAARLLDLVAVPADARNFVKLASAGRLTPGVALPPAEAIFPRYVDPADGAGV
jgi:methionyl-tRNA synthetase